MYLARVRPLSDVISQRGFVIAEVGFVLILGFICLTGALHWDSATLDMLGWVTIIVIIAVIVACWANLLVNMIPNTIRKIKAKCHRKQKAKKCKDTFKEA